MDTNLYTKSRYTAQCDWLINKNIQEWDLSKANISILRTLNLITQKEYDTYYNMSREDREYTIGCLRRDNKKIEEGYQYGILNARRMFFENNNILDTDVLYIDNDSITTVHEWNDIRANNINGKIGPILEFRLKNRYTSFYKLFMIDFLYYYEGNIEKFRFKNVNENKIRSNHSKYFIDLLLSIAYSAQNNGIVDTIALIKDIYENYCNRSLDIGYYREFNIDSRYRLFSTEYHTYYADDIRDKNIEMVDISYNASLIRLLYKIFMTEYFRST